MRVIMIIAGQQGSHGSQARGTEDIFYSKPWVNPFMVLKLRTWKSMAEGQEDPIPVQK